MSFATQVLLDTNFSQTEEEFVEYFVNKKLADMDKFLKSQITDLVLTKVPDMKDVSLKTIFVKQFFTTYVYNEARTKEEQRARQIYRGLLFKKK